MTDREAPPPPSGYSGSIPYLQAAKFIRNNTMVLAPPLVPEFVLHLAEESLPIWLKTEEELQKANIDPPYWAFAWAGGQALARYVLDNRALIAGKRVLDLGSGSGLVAIAAHRAGAAFVTAADIDPMATAAAVLNAELNTASLEAVTCDLLAAPAKDYDVILVGDLFYEAPLAKRVLEFIATAASNGAVVFVGDPRRSYFPANKFECLAEYAVPVTRQLEDAEIKKAAVWRFAVPESLP